jgi:hypothetical protein
LLLLLLMLLLLSTLLLLLLFFVVVILSRSAGWEVARGGLSAVRETERERGYCGHLSCA